MNRVSLRAARDYAPETVSRALSLALADIGGLASIVPAGSRVLIKPNLLLPVSPDKCATTHPAVVEALVRAVQAAGATPILAECPGGTFAPAYLKKVYAVTGMTDVAQRTGCEILFSYEDVLASCPEGKVEKHPRIASVYQTCDLVISCAKLKTHGYMTYTGAVKNMFGAVPGLYKAQYHLQFPQIEDFAALINDLFLCTHPCLCVVDAVCAMEGDGPSGGTPRPLGFLAVGQNGHFVDLACAEKAGIALNEVPTLREAAERGLFSPDALAVLGDPIDPVCDFARPRHQKKAMSPASNPLVARLTRPFSRAYPLFLKDKCKKCGICVKNCPPQALTMGERAPRLDKSKCIRCFCCHELCPSQAIDIRRVLRRNKR